MTKSIYLDYTAATPMDTEVLAAMQPYYTDNFYNPSAGYTAAKQAKQAVEKARSVVASYLGAKSSEVIFTAGSTEANNLVIQGVMRQFPDGEMLISAIEHDSAMAPAKLFKHQVVPVDKQGIIDLDALTKMINDHTVLVCVMMVSNELGTLQPIAKIGNLLQQIRSNRRAKNNKRPIYLYTDAAQAAGYFDLQASRLNVDLMSINGAKIYGPKQVGALFVKTGTLVQPFIVGGGQEKGLRSGTENIAGAVGLAKALELAQDKRAVELKRINSLRDLFIRELAQKLPQAIINGSLKHQSPSILSVSFPGVDNERLMMELDEAGVQASVGSACAASNGEPSYVLKAIGLADAMTRSTMRFSFGRATTDEDIYRVVELLAKFCHKES